MAGVNTILRIVAAPLTILILVFVGWVGVKLFDPISQNVGGPPASLGWPSNEHFYFFMALAMISLVLVVFVWLWAAPIREDVRQEAGPRGPF